MFWRSLVSPSSHPRDGLRPASSAGFGLIELIVSISIMVLVSAIVLAKNNSFNGAVLLRSQAYDVALHLREIQLSAVSAASDGAGGFRTVLGVRFHSNPAANGAYTTFEDDDSDYEYDAGEEYGGQGFLDDRFEIREIRVDTGAGMTVHTDPVVIFFERPNFDAEIYDDSGASLGASAVEIDIARRGVSGSGVEVVRTVEVTATGQIAVQ